MTDLSKLSDAQLAAIAGEIDPDTDALVRTVFGEAANQGPIGRKAVAAVARNRSRLSGQSIGDVVRAPGQFEPWSNPGTRQRMERLDPAGADYQSILADIEGDDDPTGGATHFYAPKAQAALGRAAPTWDDGSGTDIGDHRFFKLSYGGQPAQAAPSIDDMSDEELEAIANGPPEPAPQAKGGDDVGAQFVSMPATASEARKSTVVDADEGKAATPAQESWYVGEVKAGRLDPAKVRAGEYRAGSEAFPLLQRDPQDLPKPGDWYVTPEGEKRQVPEVPMLDTVGNVARLALDPTFRLAAQSGAPVLDPRSAAMLRAAESGVMLGGRNELRAGIESLPGLLEGGIPLLKDRFGDNLEREDRASAQARRDFPIAYDATAAAGALASGGAIPAGAVPRIATGGASGFLATDGDVGRRAVGAGVGVLGGEALNFIAPRVAGAVMDMTGLPLRAPAAAGQVQRSPLTGFELSEAPATNAERRAAEAISRRLDRDSLVSSDIPMMASDGVVPFQLGDNLSGLAEVVAQSPGPGQRILREKGRELAGEGTRRVKEAAGETFGGDGSYFAKLGEAKANRSNEASRGMGEIGQHEVTLDDNSVQALRSDLARSAVREQALNALASPDAAIRDAGARLNRLYDDLLDKPSAQTITVRDAQDISKSLLDAANDAYSGGNGSRGAALKALGKAVRQNAATPERGGFREYGDWLQRYGEDSDAIEALQAGRGVFSGQMDVSAETLRKNFAGWTDAAKENYRLGVGEAILDQVRRKGGPAEARKLLKDQEFADRIRIAVPDDMSFHTFMRSLEREADIAGRGDRVFNGPRTFARLAENADLSAQGADALDVAAQGLDLVLSPVQTLTGKALKETIKALPRKDRSLIGDEKANAALAKALSDPAEMTRLLNMLEHYRATRAIPMRGEPGALGGVAGSQLLEATR